MRDWVKPFEEKIDWPSFSFTFSPDDVGPSMVDVLRAVPPEKLLEMQVLGSLVTCDTGYFEAETYVLVEVSSVYVRRLVLPLSDVWFVSYIAV